MRSALRVRYVGYARWRAAPVVRSCRLQSATPSLKQSSPCSAELAQEFGVTVPDSKSRREEKDNARYDSGTSLGSFVNVWAIVSGENCRRLPPVSRPATTETGFRRRTAVSAPSHRGTKGHRQERLRCQVHRRPSEIDPPPFLGIIFLVRSARATSYNLCERTSATTGPVTFLLS